MAKKLKPDRVLFFVTLALVGFGVAMVFSSSAIVAKEKFGDPNYFSFKQLIFAALGLAVMFIVMKVDYHAYRNPAVVFSALSIVVGLLVLVFFLAAAANTHRWIQLAGFSVQPSELAKLALIFFLAYFLEKRKGKVNDLTFTLIPIAIVVALLAGLIVLQPDLGTAISLLVISVVLLFVAGLDLRWIAASIIFAVPAFYLLVFRVKYRRERILAFMNPWEEPLGRGFQIIQSLLSVASGGIAGLGFMEGKQKLFYLPEAHTDFIFAVVGEEMGMIGTCGVLLLFTVFLWRGVRTSMRAPDVFGFYLALGITMMVCVQAFINMSVVLGLLPTKGIPLPFLSYGGSSFVVMLAAVGILLNVSQHSN
ncbi:MAG: putative lipid II flippase FtsW [Acidobacteria bacterium]|nr:MAG: putative lipid II flippase FtsW [Acidobacteriota bacterium]